MLHIYVGDSYINIDNNKLGFLYRHLLNNMGLQINSLTFIDYEDLKKELLKLMKEENLLVE